MDEAIIRLEDLRGESVYFHYGGRKQLAQVTQVWPGMGKVPGVNLTVLETGDERTSVPHVSSVLRATSFFWTLGLGDREVSV